MCENTFRSLHLKPIWNESIGMIKTLLRNCATDRVMFFKIILLVKIRII